MAPIPLLIGLIKNEEGKRYGMPEGERTGQDCLNSTGRRIQSLGAITRDETVRQQLGGVGIQAILSAANKPLKGQMQKPPQKIITEG